VSTHIGGHCVSHYQQVVTVAVPDLFGRRNLSLLLECGEDQDQLHETFKPLRQKAKREVEEVIRRAKSLEDFYALLNEKHCRRGFLCQGVGPTKS
jgi:hypothetical protein